ncbi:MAG: Asp-tRNA(Asn)/Glu-tRNA(Gln) amidotransferase subunit GatB [Candidatus Omnitrophica bacterium]|nr:Asp-tRNA(Asn)/Glu-tRNA(Gln) amidotransferase subunit GatB [Candidatus Omnitrophota bacterium]
MYESVIGLEVHVQLNTATKLFCGCSTEFGSQPNSQACEICLGLPGCLPVLNQKAFVYALKVAMALGCRIREFTKFDRKNYFYPDLPKNYQISQYDLPLAEEGFLDIDINGRSKRVNIKRVHLEEDAGKLIHSQGSSLVDLNRTGIPLLEIVSSPDINSSQEAYEYLNSLKQIIQYLGVSSCDMEKGILRCDANISIKKKEDSKLGTKTELKNMNSFRGVRDALDFEIKRQLKLLESKESIAQETRLWDEEKQMTYPMRTKEEAQDYRYFPEPDLPPFTIDSKMQEEIRKTIPELPQQKMKRFREDWGVPAGRANILASSIELADFSEKCFNLYAKAENITNWICGPLLSEMNNRKQDINQINITPKNFVDLIIFFDQGKLSNLNTKNALAAMIDSGKEPGIIIQEKNLSQISDSVKLDEIVSQVIKDNPKSVNDYLQGKENAVMFLVGQVMRKSKSKANPKMVREILLKKLKKA